MTAYSDWIQDFPSRARDLLDWYKEDAGENNREVTLLLCVGGLLLSAPYERLRNRGKVEHSQGDRKDWLIGDFDGTMELSFNDVMTRWNLHSECWQYGNVRDSDHPASPDDWKNDQGRSLNDDSAWAPPQDLKLDTVITTMRNALAHGQVITYSSNSQISKLIFLSERSQKNKPLTENQRQRLHKELKKKLANEVTIQAVMNVINSQTQPEKTRYRFIAVTPDEWLTFLNSWADMLKKFENTFPVPRVASGG
jgi:hypothetical protein